MLDQARQQSSSPIILIEIANVFESMSLSEQAGIVLEQGITKHPDDPRMAIAFANYCYKQNQPETGLKVSGLFASTDDATNDILLTHAHLLKATGRTDDAIIFYKKVLLNDSKSAIALSSLGGLALDARQYRSAIEYYRAAHKSEPGNSFIETQLAHTEFRCGDLENAWIHYNARFGHASSAGSVERRTHPYPQWNGKPLTHGKLLIWCEQAVGEELLYSTMLNDAAEAFPMGVIVECDARLKPLFERSFKKIAFVARGNPPDLQLNDKTIIAQCSAGQLGSFFRNSFEHFPKTSVQLKADVARTKELRDHYEHHKRKLGKTGLIIGISWKSKPFLQGDPKSSALSDWRILFEQSPHYFVSLQYGDITQDLEFARQQNWSVAFDKHVDQFKSLDDFAAQVSAMDKIVSVSNTTAHMAGVCGIPSAILLPASRGLMWHWFDKETPESTDSITHSPWYSSLTLLRQQEDGKWQDVLRQARDYLQPD
ncbi:MAG: hypothetical protein K2Q32_04945 [Alphaproteobacteria bacterium]|nr:hypothetical protein [Alphaproteobacteria bacterium]